MDRNRNHENTNPIGAADAYRAAGRNREAQTLERMASACGLPESAPPIPRQLLEALRELQSVRVHARSLGLFVESRDLLDCGVCGLAENVLIGGILVTNAPACATTALP